MKKKYILKQRKLFSLIPLVNVIEVQQLLVGREVLHDLLD